MPSTKAKKTQDIPFFATVKDIKIHLHTSKRGSVLLLTLTMKHPVFRPFESTAVQFLHQFGKKCPKGCLKKPRKWPKSVELLPRAMEARSINCINSLSEQMLIQNEKVRTCYSCGRNGEGILAHFGEFFMHFVQIGSLLENED